MGQSSEMGQSVSGLLKALSKKRPRVGVSGAAEGAHPTTSPTGGAGFEAKGTRAAGKATSVATAADERLPILKTKKKGKGKKKKKKGAPATTEAETAKPAAETPAATKAAAKTRTAMTAKPATETPAATKPGAKKPPAWAKKSIPSVSHERSRSQFLGRGYTKSTSFKYGHGREYGSAATAMAAAEKWLAAEKKKKPWYT